MAALLRVENACKSFGAVRVIDRLSVCVSASETLGILGPNGAGKTTLFNVISGELRLDSGRIEFDGVDIGGQPPHRRCRAGIGRSHQIPRPFGAMTVFENVVTAACFGARQRERDAYGEAVRILDNTGLLEKANRLAGGLTLLDRKRLELARALATRPRVLLLDEIAGGLTQHETDDLLIEIGRLKARGITMLWIEHVVRALLSVADRLIVMHFGRVFADGPPEAVMDDPEVRRVYMGDES